MLLLLDGNNISRGGSWGHDETLFYTSRQTSGLSPLSLSSSPQGKVVTVVVDQVRHDQRERPHEPQTDTQHASAHSS